MKTSRSRRVHSILELRHGVSSSGATIPANFCAATPREEKFEIY